MNRPDLEKNQGIKPVSWVIICRGNILRSQVLEQYLRHHSSRLGLTMEFHSAGVAEWDEFPDTDGLLLEIAAELDKRHIPHSLHRNAWDSETEIRIQSADLVLFADVSVMTEAVRRLGGKTVTARMHTFYEMISEGEKDFEDTYDYEKKRQDPIRFRNAFDELDRIAGKMLTV